MPDTAEPVQRIAIYARVSTDEQREGQTIDSQVAELERFSREKAWPITGIYRDDGWSGGVMERPELDRLRDDARKGAFDAVLINDVDRLARDLAHLGVIKRDLERNSVRVIFRKLPSDTSPTSNLMVNILGSFAEFERELISDRTRRGRRHKVEVRKQYLGSNTAYGYRYIPMDRLSGRDGILQIDAAEAKIVQQMFEWVDRDGLSAYRVKKRLDELKIPPKKRALCWGKSSVLRILHCETYAGVWHYNKFQGCEPQNPTARSRYRRRTKCSLRQRPKSEWLPLELPEALRIVPRDRWERVQRQLRQNIAFSPRNEKHRYLLKGLVRCGACGGRLVGDPGHGRFSYRCIKRCKRTPIITEHILNDAVKGALSKVLLNPAVILDPLRKLNAAEQRQTRQREDTAKTVERESERLDSEEQRVLDVYRSGLITPTQLGGQLEKLKAQRAALDLKKDHSGSAPTIPPAEVEKSVTEYCAEAARNLSTFNHDEWQELLRTVIDSIIFDGAHVAIRGKIPVSEAGDLAIPITVEGAVASKSCR
jgi:site-specific DNA recombinase